MQRLQTHIKKIKERNDKLERDNAKLQRANDKLKPFPKKYLFRINEEMESALNQKRLRKGEEPVVLSIDRLTVVFQNGSEAGYAFADMHGTPYTDKNGKSMLVWTMIHDANQELERQREVERQREHQRDQELEQQRELERDQELERNQELERQQERQLREELQSESELTHEPNILIEEAGCDIDFTLVERVQRPNLNLSGMTESFTQEDFIPGNDYYLVKSYIPQERSGIISTTINYYDIDGFEDWVRNHQHAKCKHPEYPISLRLDNIKRFTYRPLRQGGKRNRTSRKLISRNLKKSKRNL